MTHYLKTWPNYFEDVRSGRKTFDVRRDDRGFALGDKLVLQEWDPDSERFTGREERRSVTYLTNFEQKAGFVVMGLERFHD